MNVIATRRERVVLDLEDNFTAGVARAAVASRALAASLDNLNRSSTGSGKGLDDTSRGVDGLGTSGKRSGPEIDKLSGRLRLLTDAAVTLGPALIPLGAAGIPLLTGALAGLGAAAGGIGTAVLAFQGMGDALKAIDTARLEPTAENLQAMRVALQQLGPAGEDFARYLSNLNPLIEDLQRTAGAHLFDGLKDGLTDLQSRGPEVEEVINRLSKGMGDLARDAGRSLSSDEWTPFFDYVERTARPTLEAFGHATGNVALGVANMLVAFDPLTSGFVSGLEDATAAFAEWTTTLDTNESFQSFVDYIRDSGPQAIEFLGAIGGALAALVQAAAPLGQVVLPALTAVANVFAAIAGSPIGPGLYAAAAGLLAFNRAAALTQATSSKLTATFESLSSGRVAAGAAGGIGLLALSLTDLDEKAGVANTALGATAGLMVGGPWGAAIGAGVGAIVDFTSAQDEMNDALQRSQDIARDGSLAEQRAEYQRLSAEIAATAQAQDDYWTTTSLATTKRALGGWLFGTRAQEDALADLQTSMRQTGDLADLFGESIGQTGDQFRLAAADAEVFSGALADLNGWFSKRDAIIAYKNAVHELAQGLDDGFGRKDLSNINAVGESILQVASQMKSPVKRANFLAEARAQLDQLAKNSGPKAAAAIQQVIDKFDNKGLTHPKIDITADDRRARAVTEPLKRDLKIMGQSTVKPAIDANDNPFRQIYKHVKGDLTSLDTTTAKPNVNVDPGSSASVMARLKAQLDSFHDRTVHLNVITNHLGGGSVTSTAGGHSSTPTGEGAPNGGRIAPRMGRSSSVTVPPLTGMDVYTNSRASSGSKGDLYASTSLSAVDAAARGASDGLRGLQRQLAAQQKAFDQAKQARDDAVSRRDAISGGIQQGLMGDSIWAASSGSVWAAGAHGANSPLGAIAALNARADRGRRFIAALATLKGKGVTGAALQEIISEGLEAAEAMAAADVTTLSTFASSVNESNQVLAAAGLAGGSAIEGANVSGAEQRLDRIHDDLKRLEQAVRDADGHNQKGHKDNAQFVAGAVNGGAASGHRRRKRK